MPTVAYGLNWLNGFGRVTVMARGAVRWGGPPDFDGVECLCVLWLPIIPLRPVHTYNWSLPEAEVNWFGFLTGHWHVDNVQTCEETGLRWSPGLVARAFVRQWSQAALLIGGIPLCIMGLLHLLNSLALVQFNPDIFVRNAYLEQFGASAAAAGAVGLALNWLTDRRRRRIRYVLGRHQLGSSDPVDWLDEAREHITPQDMFGTLSFRAAVEPLMVKGDFAMAMMAARLCAAAEDRARGEEATDCILGNPRVAESIRRVRRDPECWPDVMRGCR